MYFNVISQYTSALLHTVYCVAPVLLIRKHPPQIGKP